MMEDDEFYKCLSPKVRPRAQREKECIPEGENGRTNYPLFSPRVIRATLNFRETTLRPCAGQRREESVRDHARKLFFSRTPSFFYSTLGRDGDFHEIPFGHRQPGLHSKKASIDLGTDEGVKRMLFLSRSLCPWFHKLFLSFLPDFESETYGGAAVSVCLAIDGLNK